MYRYSSGYTAVETNISISKRDVIRLPHLEMGNSRSPSCQCNPRTTQVIKRLVWEETGAPKRKQASGPELQVPSVGTMESWRVCRAWTDRCHQREPGGAGGQKSSHKPPCGILCSSASKLLQTTLALLLSLSLPCQPFADFRLQGKSWNFPRAFCVVSYPATFKTFTIGHRISAVPIIIKKKTCPTWSLL